MANNIQPRLYISELNNYCLRKNMKVFYEEISVTGPPHNMEFTFKAVIGDRDFPEGKGKSKKEAKNVAAKQALLILEKEDMSSVMSPQPSQNSSVSESQTPPSMNYIALLNQNVQKKRLTLDFIKQPPTPGFSSFAYICKVGKISYGPGTGSSKQEAKQAAAKIACQKMQLGDISQESDSTPSSACALACTDSSSTSMSTSTLNGVVVESGFSEDTSERNSNNSLQNISSWSPKSTGGCQQKVKRFLAPTFQKQLDINEKEENMHSCNKRFLNDFYDIKILSRGGYGQVFKGIHKLDKKSYAIKRVKFDNEKVEREVEVLAKLDHENIIKYSHCWAGHDICDTEKSGYFSRSKCLFIVMELCERGTLKDWIDCRRGSELDKALSLNLFQQITAGVEYIHSNNLIHRDLKPSNIFLVDETKIKIGDFGLVTLLKTKDDRTKGVGTPLYMSPEQIFSLEYGNKVDIFSLGLILFQLLYISATVQEISKIWENVKKCVFPEEFINKYPKEQLMVVKLLSKNPEDRPKASNILKILKAWEKEESGREIMYPRTC
ncbi:interferon-induced, double-stranded RNA-activated protein kinase isoform X2 [Sminthopsis crassicaudata]